MKVNIQLILIGIIALVIGYIICKRMENYSGFFGDVCKGKMCKQPENIKSQDGNIWCESEKGTGILCRSLKDFYDKLGVPESQREQIELADPFTTNRMPNATFIDFVKFMRNYNYKTRQPIPIDFDKFYGVHGVDEFGRNVCFSTN